MPAEATEGGGRPPSRMLAQRSAVRVSTARTTTAKRGAVRV